MKCGYCRNHRNDPNWLYVVAAREGNYPVKVGISRSVGSRMATHRKMEKRSDLYAAHRIEFCCEYVASKAEQIALDDLRANHVNIRGDWFDCPINTAIDATLRAQVAV